MNWGFNPPRQFQPFTSVHLLRVQDPRRQFRKNQEDCGGKDLWNRRVRTSKSEIKGRGSDDGESEGGNCDEVNQEESEQDEVGWRNNEGSWSHR